MMTTWDKQFWSYLDYLRHTTRIEEISDFILSLSYLKYLNDNQSKYELEDDAKWEIFTHESVFGPIIKKVQRAFETIEYCHPSLDKTFSYLRIPYDNYFLSEPRHTRELIDQISRFDFSSGKEFSDCFDDLLFYFNSSYGKRGAGEIQPKELTHLMQSLIPNRENQSIYNPFAGYASFGLNIPKGTHYVGEEINQRTAAIGRLRLAINYTYNMELNTNDCIRFADKGSRRKYSTVIFNPPFNVRFNEETYDDLKYINSRYLIKNNANAFIIGEMLSKLSDGGKVIFLMPNGFLTSSIGQEVELKKMILKDFNLESITALPGNIVSNTNISLNLIVISKNKPTGKVKMVDASQGFLKSKSSQKIIDVKTVSHLIKNEESSEKVLTVSEKDIKLNDFSFLPQRYLIDSSNELDLSNAISLDDVLTYKKPIRYQKNESGKKIGIKELQDSPDQFTIDYSLLTNEELPVGAARLNRNSLLVASKGLKLKPTYIGNVGMDLYYTPQNIFEFNVELDKANIDYLISELHKDYVKRQLAKFTVGAGIPSISKKQLLSVRIFLPSLEEQKQIVEKEKTERFQEKLKELGFEREIARIRKEQKEDLNSKKHNIMQHINNVKSSADVLVSFMEKNGGQLKANDIINPRRGVTVEQRFRRLVDSLEDSIYYINNLTNELRFGERKLINLKELLDVCIEKGIQGNNYEVLPLEVDETSFIESSNIIQPIVFISPDDFEEVYNNLLENAVRHGFLKIDRLYSFRIEMSYDSDVKQVVIRFSNNGEPLPKGMAERYGIKGEKAGKTGNKGFGAWKIKQIVNYWEADFKVIDSSDSTYQVAFELRLNVEQE